MDKMEGGYRNMKCKGLAQVKVQWRFRDNGNDL
jgi:hypothetical protein